MTDTIKEPPTMSEFEEFELQIIADILFKEAKGYEGLKKESAQCHAKTLNAIAQKALQVKGEGGYGDNQDSIT